MVVARENGLLRSIDRYRLLFAGIAIVLVVSLFGLVGSVFVPRGMADVGAARVSQPPSAADPLGTDQQGRDVLADMIYGTPASLEVGLIAGVIGVTIGALMGMIGGYAGGIVDEVIRVLIDVLLTIPSLMILIIVASMVGVVSIESMALIIAALAWMWPARTIRAQVLTIRERMYVQVAKLNGASPLKIIGTELLPNLMPYIAANLVGAVSGAILASVGLSTLGLGPMTSPSLGLTIYWAIHYGALIRKLWWWFMPPIVIIVILFLGLFMVSQGLDRIANPRLQTKV
ncbi:MAG TPA: ABC transporter permease [Chloroflexota bacterium]|nr:ABC transporter permease [Chloroflexota bacterium]